MVGRRPAPDDGVVNDPSSSTLPPPAPPPLGGSRPRLTRATDDTVIGGVCAGVARHLGVDPTLVRLATVAAVFFGGVGVLAYLLAWAIIPTDRSVGQDPSGAPTIGGRGIGGANGAGVLLAGAGAVLLLIKLDDVADAPVVPLLLIGLGAVLLWGRRDDDRPGPPPRVEPPWWAGPPPPSPASPERPPTTPVDAPPTVDASGTHPATRPADPVRRSAATDVDPTYRELDEPMWDAAAGRWVSGVADAAPGSVGALPPPAPARPSRRQGRSLAVVVGAVLVALGLSGLAVLVVGGASGFSVLGAVLVGVGVVIAAGSLVGGAKRLVPGALVVLAVMAATSVLDVPLGGGVGERTLVATVDATLPGTPHLSAGELVLDLRSVDAATGAPSAPIEATVGLGALVVELPPDLAVEVVAHASLGAITIDADGESDGGDVDLGGVDVDHRQRFGPDSDGPPDLVLDLRVGLGEVEVIQHGD